MRQIRQWTEADRSGGASNDPTVGPVGSFQYSSGIDIRNNLGGIQLQSDTDIAVISGGAPCAYGQNGSQLYKFLTDGKVIVTSVGAIGGTPATLTGFTLPDRVQDVVVFDSLLYVLTPLGRIYTVSGTTATPVTPTQLGTTITLAGGTGCMLSFWNTYLIVGQKNMLLTKTRGLNEWFIARQYDDDATIVGIETAGSSILVFVRYSSSQTTKRYVISGTFQQEDVGVSQGDEWTGSMVMATAPMKSGNYAVIGLNLNETSGTGQNNTWSLYLGSGPDSYLVKEGLNKENVAYMRDEFMLENQQEHIRYPVSRDIMYIPARDGLWSYGMNKLGTGYQLIKEYDHTDVYFSGGCVVSGGFILAGYESISTGAFAEVRYKIGNNKNPYSNVAGVIISRVFTGPPGLKGKKKILLGISVGYDLSKTTGGSIDIYLRKNRSSYDLTTGFVLIGTITATNEFVWDQTPGVNMNNNLGMDFWSLEYKALLRRGTDPKGTPIFCEVNILYDISDNSNNG